ncbi:hypothetical protein IT571_11415 [Candidatus Sumerlaeota bacterium]|nr:hypothetical protein [Candidatus Sumerlaeota bacterium]
MNDNRVSSREWGLLGALLAVFFLVAFVTYSHLGEDAFITFRYTRNFAKGLGLVFNEGERVEGYSNLLWLLVLTPFEWLGIRLHVAARILSTLSFAGIVVAGWWCARRLAQREDRTWIRWWLPAAIALEPFLHYHDDRGLETVSYAAALAGALFVLAGGGGAWIAGLFAVAATLLRPEGIGFVAPLVVVAALDREVNFARAVKFIAPAVTAFVLQTIFRKVYYHEWIPNTMLAKHASGLNFDQLIAMTCSHAFVPAIGLVGCVAGCCVPHLRRLAVGSLLMLLAAAAFSLRAGSLLNESFRYLVAAMIPSVIGVWLLLQVLQRAKWSGLVAVALLVLVPVTIFREGSRYLRGNGDAPRSQLLARFREAQTWDLAERWRWFFHDPIYINAEAGRWTAENLPERAVIGADQIGQFGFYAGDNQRIVDVLGLADRHVARHGLTMDYLAQRNPDYLVIQTNDDSTLWPRDWRMEPSVASLRPVMQSPEFRKLYRPRWFLRSRATSLFKFGFMVYIRNDGNDAAPQEDVLVGVSDEEFEQWWRVKWEGGE